MRPLVARRRAPSCGFEWGGVDEALVYGEESFAHPVRNVVEIARAQLVGDETGDSLVGANAMGGTRQRVGCAAQHSLFDLNDRHGGEQVGILQG